jgi:tetratricopeptide (TPR) repeat protein
MKIYTGIYHHFLKTPGLQKLFMIFVIIAVSLAVYLNALSNGFVYDDKAQVTENVWIKDVSRIPEIFTSSAWGFLDERLISNYYRPLMHLIFMGNYYIFGLNPLGFHLVNVFFHTAVSVLVFILLLRLLKPLTSSLPPFIAALLFATHPIHTEAVTWVSGVTELSYTFFLLLSFYLYIKSGEGFKTGYLLSLASFFLSTLCKETALTLPLILIAYDYSLGKAKKPLIKQFRRYIPFFIVVGIYLILRFNALGGLAPQPPRFELSAYEYAINVFPLFAQYLWKLILPINLNAFYVLHPIKSIFELKGIISVIVTIAFASVAFLAFKKSKTAFIALLFIVLPLIPVLYIPGLGENVFTERYLYLPSLGFVILVALLISRVKADFPKAALTLTTVFILISGLYSIQTITRNYIWIDNLTLFKETVKKSPDSAIVHYNLGVALSDARFTDEAMKHYMTAVAIKPDYPEAYNNLGIAYCEKVSFDKGIEYYLTAIKFKPDYAEVYNNLGVAYFKKGLTDTAIEYYQIALRLKPDYPKAHHNLGIAFAGKGWIDKAIEHYKAALNLKPDSAEIYNDLGIVYITEGLPDKAIENYEAALRLKQDSPELHNNIGNAYAANGLFDKAIEHYQTAIELKPDYAESHYNLGIVYEKMNSLYQALSEYQKALSLNPQHEGAKNSLNRLAQH